MATELNVFFLHKNSRYNEDQVQCAIGEISIPHKSLYKIQNNNTRKAYLADKNRGVLRPIRYLYIGLFDGHGGPGVAIKASKELHQIVHEGLEDVIEYLIQCDDGYCDGRANKNTKEDKEQGKTEF
jgi:serine/threonine protein phosphatase PrpC